MTGKRDRWAELTGGQAGEEYARRFARLAESGHDIHGEATFCAALVEPAARVLDAGCGTGRIAVRLAELGHRCTGVDIDASMLAVARRHAPAQEWLLGDLARTDTLGLRPDFDLVLAAGNVIPSWPPAPKRPSSGSWPPCCGPAACWSRAWGWTPRTCRCRKRPSASRTSTRGATGPD